MTPTKLGTRPSDATHTARHHVEPIGKGNPDTTNTNSVRDHNHLNKPKARTSLPRFTVRARSNRRVPQGTNQSKAYKYAHATNPPPPTHNRGTNTPREIHAEITDDRPRAPDTVTRHRRKPAHRQTVKRTSKRTQPTPR